FLYQYPPTTLTYPLSLHDALPISAMHPVSTAIFPGVVPTRCPLSPTPLEKKSPVWMWATTPSGFGKALSLLLGCSNSFPKKNRLCICTACLTALHNFEGTSHILPLSS